MLHESCVKQILHRPATTSELPLLLFHTRRCLWILAKGRQVNELDATCKALQIRCFRLEFAHRVSTRDARNTEQLLRTILVKLNRHEWRCPEDGFRTTRYARAGTLGQ